MASIGQIRIFLSLFHYRDIGFEVLDTATIGFWNMQLRTSCVLFQHASSSYAFTSWFAARNLLGFFKLKRTRSIAGFSSDLFWSYIFKKSLKFQRTSIEECWKCHKKCKGKLIYFKPVKYMQMYGRILQTHR